MNTLSKSISAAALCLVAAFPLHAGHGHHHGKGHLMDRMERQQTRIERGIESGQLTRHEAKKLRKQQRKIRRLARQFRSDGRFTKKERRIVNTKLDKASRKIRKLKHNNNYRHSTRHRDYGREYSRESGRFYLDYSHYDYEHGWPRYSIIWW